MKDTELLQLALMLTPPWQVVSCDIDLTLNRVNIDLDFTKGSRFICPKCAKPDCSVHDTEDKTWRHLNFFQHETYLHARVPRTDCPECGVKLVNVPWARPDSGFTLLFEAYIMMMAPSMAVSKIGELVSEHDTRLWRILHHHVKDARSQANYSAVRKIGVDETSSKRGHEYVSVFVDLDASRVIYATEGKDHSTVEKFKTDLCNTKGLRKKLKMSVATCRQHSSKGLQNIFLMPISPLTNSMY